MSGIERIVPEVPKPYYQVTAVTVRSASDFPGLAETYSDIRSRVIDIHGLEYEHGGGAGGYVGLDEKMEAVIEGTRVLSKRSNCGVDCRAEISIADDGTASVECATYDVSTKSLAQEGLRSCLDVHQLMLNALEADFVVKSLEAKRLERDIEKAQKVVSTSKAALKKLF